RQARRADRNRYGVCEPVRLSRPGPGLDGRQGNGQGRHAERDRLRQPHAAQELSFEESLSVMATRANWNYPTAVRFGAGRIAELPEALRTAGISRPLMVTDAGL